MCSGPLYKIAYDEAVRALSEQQAVIDSFRTRAGLLLSAAAITTSFLGAEALRGGESSLCAWLALADFVAVAWVALAILWPYGWEFAANPQKILEAYIETDRPAEIEDLQRELALGMCDSYLRNRRGVELLTILLQVGSGLLTLEIVLWIVAIASTP